MNIVYLLIKINFINLRVHTLENSNNKAKSYE